MKRLVLLLFAAVVVYGEGLELGGYAENRTGIVFTDDQVLSDVASVRLEASWDFGRNGGVETHMIVTKALQPIDPYVNVRPGSVMDKALGDLMTGAMTTAGQLGLIQEPDENLPDSALEAMALRQARFEEMVNTYAYYLPYSTFLPNDQLTLDRALLKMYFNRVDVFVGRQMIAWGTGYAFNPTDIWNRKNPLDPQAPKTGVNALRLYIPLGPLSGLTLVASTGPDFKHSSGGFRLKGNLAGFDLSVCAMRIMNADMELLGIPKKIMLGGDMAGQIGEIGIWAELAASNPVPDSMDYTDTDHLYLQADCGMDYTFENGLYVMLEYYYNGLGKYKWQQYNGQALLHLLAGEMAGFAQNYMFLGVRKDIGDRFMLSAFALTNMTDQSAMAQPSLDYSFSDNITVNVGLQLGFGDENESEYGAVYPGATLKLTGYF